MKSSAFEKTYILFILMFLYLPLAILVIFSFNQSSYSTTWTGFSWKWFIRLWEDQDLISSLKNSLLLGFLSAFISTLLSVVASSIIIFQQKSGLLQKFLLMPSFLIILPDLILGVGFLIILNLMHIPFGFFSLVIAHITFCMPYIIFTLIHQINQFNKNLYFAALDLGASKLYTWQKVLFPILRPAIFSAFLLAFTLSFDDVVISYFVAGPEFNILPLTILSMIRSGSSPELNALCSLTLILSLVLIIVTQKKLRKI
jgi:spermidine/putrescine transport system permease protein